MWFLLSFLRLGRITVFLRLHRIYIKKNMFLLFVLMTTALGLLLFRVEGCLLYQLQIALKQPLISNVWIVHRVLIQELLACSNTWHLQLHQLYLLRQNPYGNRSRGYYELRFLSEDTVEMWLSKWPPTSRVATFMCFFMGSDTVFLLSRHKAHFKKRCTHLTRRFRRRKSISEETLELVGLTKICTSISSF